MKIQLSRLLKINDCLIAWLVFFATVPYAHAQSDKPAVDSIAGLVKSGDAEITARIAQPDYIPQVGQTPIGLDDISAVITALTAISDKVSLGEQGQGSSWFVKLQSIRTGFGQLASSKLQSDLFTQIPGIADFFSASDSEPEFVSQVATQLQRLAVPVLFSIKSHIVEQNAVVAAGNLTVFVEVFCKQGFVNEPEWEDDPIPVDAAGMLILDATAVVANLKAKPWQQAERFLCEKTAGQAFARYEVSGNGLPVLKIRYAANQTAIIAKWNELIAWVAEQRAANP